MVLYYVHFLLRLTSGHILVLTPIIAASVDDSTNSLVCVPQFKVVSNNADDHLHHILCSIGLPVVESSRLAHSRSNHLHQLQHRRLAPSDLGHGIPHRRAKPRQKSTLENKYSRPNVASKCNGNVCEKVIFFQHCIEVSSSIGKKEHTRAEFLLRTIKYETKPEIPRITGRVTKAQKGQQGPAITRGVPSGYSRRTNILPSRRAQQQKYLLKSSIGPFSATSRSHLVETANCFRRLP